MNGKQAKKLRQVVREHTVGERWNDLRTVRKNNKPDTIDHVGHHFNSGRFIYQRAKRDYHGR